MEIDNNQKINKTNKQSCKDYYIKNAKTINKNRKLKRIMNGQNISRNSILKYDINILDININDFKNNCNIIRSYNHKLTDSTIETYINRLYIVYKLIGNKESLENIGEYFDTLIVKLQNIYNKVLICENIIIVIIMKLFLPEHTSRMN